MYYTNFSRRKVFLFSSLITVLFGALAVTTFSLAVLPQKYVSTQWLKHQLAMATDAFEYRLKSPDQGGVVLAAASLLGLNGSVSVASDSSPAQDIPVLLYHGIVDNPDRFSLAPEEFWDQMSALKKAGYRTITLQEFEDFVSGKSAPKGKVFLLTFDDGRTDSYYQADPVLQALGFHAVMFIATQSSFVRPNDFDSYYLNQESIQAMVDSGRWDIGSHTVQETGGYVPIDAAGTQGNFLSNKKWLTDAGRLETDAEYAARVQYELTYSKSELERRLGITITAMSYPFSDFGNQSINNQASAEAVIRAAVKDTYDYAFRQTTEKTPDFISNYPAGDPLQLRRIEVDTSWSGDQLVSYLQTVRSKSLPYADSFSEDTGWLDNWGEVVFQPGSIRLEAQPDTTGAFTFLDGSQPWQNYFYSTTVDWDEGGYVSLIARYQNSGNYISCTFGAGRVHIDQNINGAVAVLTDQYNSIDLPRKGVRLSMYVDDNLVKCYEGSTAVATGYTISTLDHGGVGVRVWDPDQHAAAGSITSVTVIPAEQATDFKNSLPNY
ncbi:MAG TPA: polysaccharide deacetylase family protein [Candidatus Paceibacterota bacterium]|nr:polysaccharide deacetylase family protein [Candidatus Paceibacterota bacterium]